MVPKFQCLKEYFPHHTPNLSIEKSFSYWVYVSHRPFSGVTRPSPYTTPLILFRTTQINQFI